MIRLCADSMKLDVMPTIGGAVANLWRGDRPILRPMPEGSSDVLQAAMFPLVPFANRIRDGAFQAGERVVKLPPNFGESPHPLHGHGWHVAWQVADVSATCMHLSYRHFADAWPWDYEAVLVYQLRPNGLRTSLRVTNLSKDPMPAGLGFHPYFRLSPHSRLQTTVDGMWEADEDTLPSRWRADSIKSWNNNALVGDNPSTIDHCHSGFSGTASLYNGEHLALTLLASENCRWLHIFVPQDLDYFCVEPVTHMPDPFSHPLSGLQLLSQGQTLDAWMDLNVYDQNNG